MSEYDKSVWVLTCAGFLIGFIVVAGMFVRTATAEERCVAGAKRDMEISMKHEILSDDGARDVFNQMQAYCESKYGD